MHDVARMGGQQVDVGLVDVDGMDCDKAGPRRTERVQTLKRPDAVTGDTLCPFVRCLEQVRLNRQLELSCIYDDFAPTRIAHCVRSVRS